MNKDSGGTLLRIAKQVADEKPVDWMAEGAANSDLARTIRRLELFAAVMAAHRKLHGGSAEILKGAAAPAQGKTTSASKGGADLLSQRFWGPLKILDRLGQGGFASVYRAYDPSLRREVALKLLRADCSQADSDKFLKEARLLARVRHPNVLAVYGADRHNGQAGIWTELLHGVTLEDALAQQGPLGAQEAAMVGIDLCRALAAVHASGLIHGDVKTANVLRERGGRIVLTDFGSVTERLPDPGEEECESPSGTPLFMSPERLRDERSGPGSDLYSTGVVLFRLVTGRFPVEARNLSELLQKHEAGERVPLGDVRPDLSASFVQAVERALASDPAARYLSAGAMGNGLASSAALPLPAEPVVADGSHPRLWTGRTIWAAALVLAVTAAIALYILSRPSPLTAEVNFYRVADGTPQALPPGARLSPGDAMFAEIEGSAEMSVYVLDEDARGHVFVLFPVPGLDRTNPLPPRIVHRLPGYLGGEAASWQVTSVGGRETILIIASKEPLRQLEKEISGFSRALPGVPVSYGELSGKTVRSLRGMGGIVTTDTPEAGGGDLSSALVNVAKQGGKGSSIWVSRYEFENPGP